jgi:nitric oxide reductase large subunit
MEHPFVGKLDHLTVEELQTKLSELYKKLGFVARSGNANLSTQLRMAIESVQAAYQKKLDEMIPKANDTDDKDPFTLIDIS